MFNWNVQAHEITKGVLVFDNWFSASEDLIRLGENDSRWHTGAVATSCDCGMEHDNERVTDILHLPASIEEDPMFFYVSKGLKHMGDMYANLYGTSYKTMEQPELLRYRSGQGMFNLHCDAGANFPRAFSAILYLNDVAEGGETEFPELDIKISPVAGKLILFPANFMFKHKANVPISNDKYTVATWYKYI